VSSYVFYGWWDYRFLSLIFLSTIVDYIIGINIPKQDSEKKQKLLLWCSVLFNLSVLGFFKYYNFFVDSWIDLFSSIGYEIKSVWTLNIILPVGISFYTFQTMSYTVDIYRKKLEPTKEFKIERHTFEKWVSEKGLPVKRIGYKTYVSKNELDDWLKEFSINEPSVSDLKSIFK